MARLPLVMMCLTHPDKDLEYYCADHDVMGCGACVNIGHRRCERVMFIKDIVDSTSDRRIVADAAVDLREIRKMFEDIHRDTSDIVANLELQRNEIRERRDTLKNKIMELLDKLETSSELEMEQAIQKVSQDIGDDSTSSKDILAQIDSSIDVLNAAAAHATDQQLFVAGKRSSSDRDKFTNILNNAMGSIQNVRLDFKPDPTLQRFINSLELFDGRCITSTSTKAHNPKPRNTFEPRNGFVEQPQKTHLFSSNQQQQFRQDFQEIPYIQHDIMRPEHADAMSRTRIPMSNGLPHISQRGLVSGSVPDFRNAGLRSSTSDLRSVVSDIQGQHFNTHGYQSMPQSPQHYETVGLNHQSRSMPPTPRMGEINRPQLYRKTLYERQMYDKGALPIINRRGTQSEPGFPGGFQDEVKQDFAPKAPRTVGSNSLIGQGGGISRPQPVSKVDVLTLNNQPTLQRKDSVLSQISAPSSQTAATKDQPKIPRPDILAQASPIKRRSELNPTVTALRDRKAILAGQFNVRLPEDTNMCGLKGMAILSDGRIALADYDNHNVKLFDSKLYRGIQLRLSSGPWDVTVTGQKELALSLPFEGKIQFVQVSDQLKTTRAIKMDMDCYGLVCNNQELIVVCNDYLIGPAVQVVSLTGRVKQTIDIDREGNRILIDPYYLTVTPTGKQIYVSDKDRIVCMDRHGNVTSVYQDPSLRNARGIDMDSEGNLYVCGYMSNNVYQITMHGIDFRCLVGKNNVYDPWTVRYNATGGTLLVTCDQTDMVQVFSLQ